MTLIHGSANEDAPRNAADFKSTGFDIDPSASAASLQVVVEVIDTNGNEARNGSADCVLFVRDQINQKWTATGPAVAARTGEVTPLPLSPSPIARKGIVVTSNVRGLHAAQRRVTVLGPSVLPARASSPGVAYVRWWGTSIPAGIANPTGEQCSYRGEFQRLARLGGDDVRPLGTLFSWGVANATGVTRARWTPGTSRHEGVSGNTIAQVTARIPAAVAAEYARTGHYADVEFVDAGTNDGATSVATAIANYSTLIDTLRTANQTGWIVACTLGRIPSAPVGWQAEFNAALQALVATKDSRVLFLDTCGDNTRADHGTAAGVEDAHPNRRGYSKAARRMYERFRLLCPLRSGLPSPRAFVPRLTESSTVFEPHSVSIGAGANGLRRTTGGTFETAMRTSGTSWLAGINCFFPTAFPASTWCALLGSGMPYNVGGFQVSVYGGSDAAFALYASPDAGAAVATVYRCGLPDKWMRLWAHYDGTPGYEVLSFWGTPNGFPVLFGSVAGARSFLGTFNYTNVGAHSNSAPTFYADEVELAAGSSVPTFDELLPVLERNWFEGERLPGLLSYFPLNEGTGTTAVDLLGGTALAQNGAISWVTQAHDWDG